MFKVKSICLTGEITYNTVDIIHDLSEIGLTQITPNSFGVRQNKSWIIINDANVLLIHLDDVKRSSCDKYDSIVIGGNMAYNQICVINHDNYINQGIPNVFEEYQITFSCDAGTIITHEQAVTSLLYTQQSRGVKCAK